MKKTNVSNMSALPIFTMINKCTEKKIDMGNDKDYENGKGTWDWRERERQKLAMRKYYIFTQIFMNSRHACEYTYLIHFEITSPKKRMIDFSESDVFLTSSNQFSDSFPHSFYI